MKVAVLTITIGGILVSAGIVGAQVAGSGSPARRLSDVGAAELDASLSALAVVEPDPAKRLAIWASANVGQPHAGSDPDSERSEATAGVVDWRRSGCDERDFVEQLCALAVSGNLQTAGEVLRALRYRDGVVRLENRNHNLVADWVPNNAWLLEDTTPKLGHAMAWIPLHQIVRRAQFLLSRYALTVNVPDEKFIGNFVPRVYLYKVTDELQDGDIVVFVTGNDRQQFADAMGVLRRGADGRLTMVHSRQPAAAEDKVMGDDGYTFEHKEILGYKFLRLRSDAKAQVERLRPAAAPAAP